MLPSWINHKLEQETAGYKLNELISSYQSLSSRYRHSSNKRGFTSKQEVLAYVLARLPATYACVDRCLNELPADYIPQTTLDVGCGPGTATLACHDRFENLSSVLFEENTDMVAVGQTLVDAAEWHKANILTISEFPKADLVMLSYVMNEIPHKDHLTFINKLWAAANDYLLIINPGTPDGFAQLRLIRNHLIQEKAEIVAPCPHAKDCPLSGQDWCHFSIRVNRSSVHKDLKLGDLGYEDEKFSYLLVSKRPSTEPSYNRVIKRPQHRSGHGLIDLCMANGQEQQLTYSKKKTPNYDLYKRLNWGDKVI